MKLVFVSLRMVLKYFTIAREYNYIALSFEENSRILLKKPKAAVYFNQYEYVYVLLKLLFYGIEDSTTRIMNLEMYINAK